MKFVCRLGHPLDRVRVLFLLVVLYIVQHLSQGIHLVSSALGMKQEALVVTRVDRDQVQFHLALNRAVLKYKVSGAQPQIIFYLLLNLRCLDMCIARCLNHYLAFGLKTLGIPEKFPHLDKNSKEPRNSSTMKKLEHIGIAVRNLEESTLLFAKLLGVAHYKIEEVASEGVRTSFFNVGGIKIELLEATRPDSAIATFIEKRGEGLHHLAFDVDNAKAKIAGLTADGFMVLSEKPFPGADNKLVAFIHPKTTNHVLVEICQEKDS